MVACRFTQSVLSSLTPKPEKVQAWMELSAARRTVRNASLLRRLFIISLSFYLSVSLTLTLSARIPLLLSGKELRYPVILTDYEKCIAFKLVRAFRQVVCG